MAIRTLDPAVVALRTQCPARWRRRWSGCGPSTRAEVAADMELAMHRVTQSLLHTPTMRAQELARTGDSAGLPAGAAHAVRHRDPDSEPRTAGHAG